MTDTESKPQVDIIDLLKALGIRLAGIEKTQEDLKAGQDKVVDHLAQLNGHVAQIQERTNYLQERDRSHSHRLQDHDGKIAEFMARITAVEQVTEVRDGYHDERIREAKAQSWESRTEALDTAHEVRGWFRDLVRSLLMALVIAVVILGTLALLLGRAGLL